MPFYLYGDLDDGASKLHIDHALLRSPNIQLTAPGVGLSFSSPPHQVRENGGGSRNPLLLFLDDVREQTMQPFPDKNATLASLPNFFFREGAEFAVSVWEDPAAGCQDGQEVLEAWERLGRGDGGDEDLLVGRGKMTLSCGVFVDAEWLNVDPYKRVDPVGAWLKECEKIGSD